MKLAGKVVAITGAGSGIGRAMALQCARDGALLALSDIDMSSLEATARLCREMSVEPLLSQLDVAQADQIYVWADAVATHFGGVNMIVNNAGVNLGASVEATSIEDFDWVMAVDFWSVVHGCKAFLPHLKASGKGHIVNVSSLFGLISMPNQSAYNAAKFAVRGFSESLRMELKLDKSPVNLSCVHPGGVKTNIVNSARFGNQVASVASSDDQKRNFNDRLARTTSERAAEIILNGVKKNKARILVGNDARVLDVVQRLFPSAYQKVALAFTRQ